MDMCGCLVVIDQPLTKLFSLEHDGQSQVSISLNPTQLPGRSPTREDETVSGSKK